MKLSVELNETPQLAKVVFAGKEDFGFLVEWRNDLGDDQNPVKIDAMDFAHLAVSRFEIHSPIEAYATRVTDIGDHISTNPRSEVACCVLLTCDWFTASTVIGLAHFRRTWSNNLILDYLSAHPSITRPPVGCTQVVRGVGAALIYFISTIARAHDCEYIWGEATPLSCGFYKKIFSLAKVDDLIYVPKDNFNDFIDRFGKKLEEKSGATPQDASLEAIYDVEANDSPHVGSKTAVFNPKRVLAHHFLDLPYHVQIGIATSLGLFQSDDAAQPATQQFRSFFQRASEGGRLPDLWREVEGKHPDGNPDKNPFARS